MFFKKNFAEWETVQKMKTRSTGEELVQLRIGHFDNMSDYDVVMRQDTYDKLLSGDYKVAVDTEFLVIIDGNGNEVPKVLPKGVCCEVF